MRVWLPRFSFLNNGDIAHLLRQLQGHEHTVRVFDVIGEGPADAETGARVQSLRGLEGVLGTGLETEPPIAAIARDLDDVIEQRAPGAASTQHLGRTHRFYFAMQRIELLERAASE